MIEQAGIISSGRKFDIHYYCGYRIDWMGVIDIIGHGRIGTKEELKDFR